MTKKRGFTLIELLVVIAIIGILSTLSIIALNSARARSRDAKRISDARQMRTALEMYYNDYGYYPQSSSLDGLLAISPPILTSIPTAPKPADGTCTNEENEYEYISLNPSEQNYDSNFFAFTFCLGSAIGEVPAGLNAITQSGFLSADEEEENPRP